MELVQEIPRLSLHCGNNEAAREQVRAVPTPPRTYTWRPLSHMQVIETVEDQLVHHGLEVIEEAHCLTYEGKRYFGLMAIKGHHADYRCVVGIRNSHDKRFSAGIVTGAQVMVCSNLSFSGEIMIGRKHTQRIAADLPILAAQAIRELIEGWDVQDHRIEAYKNTSITDAVAHDLIVQAIDSDVVPPSRIPRVLEEWREPQYGEFSDRNAWSLFNAFTETMKGHLHMLPARSGRLHELMDGHCGVN